MCGIIGLLLADENEYVRKDDVSHFDRLHFRPHG